MGYEKLVVTLDKKGTFSIREDIVAVDPGTRLCCSFSVMGIGGTLERLGQGEQVGEVKRLE